MSAVLILIYICGILLAISILALILAGIWGAFTKGIEIQRVGPIVIAIIAFIVPYLILGGVMEAALICMVVMLLIAILAMILTGLRGAVNL